MAGRYKKEFKVLDSVIVSTTNSSIYSINKLLEAAGKMRASYPDNEAILAFCDISERLCAATWISSWMADLITNHSSSDDLSDMNKKSKRDFPIWVREILEKKGLAE